MKQNTIKALSVYGGLCLIIAFGGGLHADSRTRALFWLEYENDANFNSLVDKYYTAGVSLGFVSREFVAPSSCIANTRESTSRTARFLRVFSAQGLIALAKSRSTSSQQRANSMDSSDKTNTLESSSAPCTIAALFSAFGVHIIQEMYAPKDRFSPIPNAHDHPYGGALYARFFAFNRSAYVFERLGIDLGLVGEAAFAKQTQDFIHDLTHNARLAGWDTQLRNEFIANLSYGISASIPHVLRYSAHWLDLMPQFSLALGNARIHAQASLLLRFGYHLYANNAPYLINSGFIAPPSTNTSSFSFYGFAGAGVRAVGRNIFLQGNTFTPHFATPHNIDMLPVVREFIWGLTLEYRRFFCSYAVVHRSKEFATQDGFASFAGITLGSKI